MKRWLVLCGAAFVAAAVMAIPAAATSSYVIVYNNIPTPTPANVPSVGAEAYAFNELGGQVHFAGTNRRNPSVTVLMSSWGCQTGNWYSNNCSTTPGSGFTLPITLNVYTVRSGNAVGYQIATETQTFKIPYRPSADPVNCTGGNAGKWFNSANSTCYNGYATPITFTLAGKVLPSNVIVSVAYNTSHYGYAPYGENTACYPSSGGCGYDSLNIGLIDNTAYPTEPSTGSDPTPNGVYQNSSIGGEYCDGGAGGTGTFRFDDGCWAPYQPAFRISAVKPGGICHVPNIIGMTIPAAKAAIKSNNCTVGTVTKVDTGPAPHTYIVTSQRPAAGTSLQQPGYVSFTAKG